MDDSVLRWMPLAYLITVAIETPVLLVGLSARHPYSRRLFAGLWLTACTYPLLWMVLPAFLDPTTQRAAYLAVGETFVAIGECALFWLAFGTRESWGTRSTARDFAAIVLANLASFGLGEVINQAGWLPLAG
jgi:hypothetical protein